MGMKSSLNGNRCSGERGKERRHEFRTFLKHTPKSLWRFLEVWIHRILYAALHYGATVRAYYVKSLQPAFEWEDAKAVVAELGADLTVIERDVLTVPEVSPIQKTAVML